MDPHCGTAEHLYDEQGNGERIGALRERGVEVWGAERVYIGKEVALDRIEPGAVLLNAVIRGSDTAIGNESKIGISGMALLVNSQVGHRVELGAGSYENTTLFDGVKVRGFAEMRAGTVLEEEAEAGHNVGLKHTFFTAGVVAGSSINFCDVVVSGGSSRQDHSEIGSGTVHFNFDPHGDKFGSLIGDATGLLLRKKRLFIGGNSGVIAPVHIGFGAVIAAGAYVREDVEENRIYMGSAAAHEQTRVKTFDNDLYYNLERKFLSTAELCGNLHALELWYQHVRIPVARDLERILCAAATRNIRTHLEHRVEQLDRVARKVSALAAKVGSKPNPFQHQHRLIGDKREAVRSVLLRPSHTVPPPAGFLQEYQRLRTEKEHCAAIHEIADAKAKDAEEWLLRTASQPKAELQKILSIMIAGD